MYLCRSIYVFLQNFNIFYLRDGPIGVDFGRRSPGARPNNWETPMHDAFISHYNLLLPNILVSLPNIFHKSAPVDGPIWRPIIVYNCPRLPKPINMHATNKIYLGKKINRAIEQEYMRWRYKVLSITSLEHISQNGTIRHRCQARDLFI